MTETPVKDETTKDETKPEVNETPAKSVPTEDKLPVMALALLNGVKPKVDELKKIADKQASVGDVGKLLSDAIEASTDPEVIKARTVIEKANEAILKAQKAAEDKVKPTLKIPTDDELKAMEDSYKTLSTEINAIAGVFNNETKKVFADITLYDYVGDLPKSKRGAKAGQGTGTVRPRVTSVEFTLDQQGKEGWEKVGKENDKGEFRSSFSHLIQKIKEQTGESLSAPDLHTAWLKEANVSDWNDANTLTTFSYPVTDKNGKTWSYWVRVTK